MDKKIAIIKLYAKPRLLHFTNFEKDGDITVKYGSKILKFSGSDIIIDGPSKYLPLDNVNSSELVEVSFYNNMFTPILSEETITEIDYIFPKLNSIDYLLLGNSYLEKVNPDIFINNKHHKKAVGLFMHCTSFDIQNNKECLINLESLENIDLAFSATGIQFLSNEVMKYLPKIKSMKRTFEQCVKLMGIAVDTFSNTKDLEILHSTFKQCSQIHHVEMDIFKDMNKLREFIDVFVNCDIRVVNPNFFCVLSYKTAYNNVFRGSKVIVLDYE
ncbi:MAG: hypothetical protein ACRCX2_36285 [Paraclostridium sp.]